MSDTISPPPVAPLQSAPSKKLCDTSKAAVLDLLLRAEEVGVSLNLTPQGNLVAANHNRLNGPYAKPGTLWDIMPPMLLCRRDAQPSDAPLYVYVVRHGHEAADIRALIAAWGKPANPLPDSWEVYPGHHNTVAEIFPDLRALVMLPVSMADLTRQESEARTNA